MSDLGTHVPYHEFYAYCTKCRLFTHERSCCGRVAIKLTDDQRQALTVAFWLGATVTERARSSWGVGAVADLLESWGLPRWGCDR